MLTGFSAESEKKIFMMISNSPHPVSIISYGGLVRTKRVKMIVNCARVHTYTIYVPLVGLG